MQEVSVSCALAIFWKLCVFCATLSLIKILCTSRHHKKRENLRSKKTYRGFRGYKKGLHIAEEVF
jgi:hypothetical protein